MSDIYPFGNGLTGYPSGGGFTGYLSRDQQTPMLPSIQRVANGMVHGNELLGMHPQLAREHAADWWRETENRIDSQRRLHEATRDLHDWHERHGVSGIANFARTAANDATFGAHDMVLGALGSHLHDASFDDAHREELMRTEDGDRDLGPYASFGAHTLGNFVGYGSLLRYLPKAMIGRGLFMPATIPLEATRGALSTPGDVSNRAIGAVRQVTDAGPFGMVNPISKRGMVAAMGTEPAMRATGLGDYQPSALSSKLATWAGLPEVQW